MVIIYIIPPWLNITFRKEERLISKGGRKEERKNVV
jgi:hypothetical protein